MMVVAMVKVMIEVVVPVEMVVVFVVVAVSILKVLSVVVGCHQPMNPNATRESIRLKGGRAWRFSLIALMACPVGVIYQRGVQSNTNSTNESVRFKGQSIGDVLPSTRCHC
jgi:hypothetical protein